ncbi:MAG: glycosyltransferase [Treponema sp.]|uniref:glycosyltransferase n=1 Tax=Treponema sp. TaxID=166 RepID=UPI001B602B08|nr:glycosyltransferase [Treponema sp.]MBP3772654.1 glycosyltransferase [Treponema sp.]MBQ9281579.1 glycosyltransferase [Treponema sp.]
MNIALFSDSYLPTKSGIVTVVVQLRKILTELGHHVVIVTVCPNGYDDSEDNDPDVLRVYSIPAPVGDNQYIAFPHKKVVINFLKQHNIQIIHSHTEFYIAHAAKSAGKALHIPVVATTHTMWEDFYKYYLFPMGRMVPVKVIRKIVKRLYKKFYALINVSEKARDYFKSPFMLPFTPSVVIPNAIDTEAFLSRVITESDRNLLKKRLGINDGDVTLIFVGRVVEEKRVEELFEVIVRVLKARENIKMVFVGSGGASYALEAETARLKLEDRIIFTGFVNWDNLSLYYSIGDIFVTASLSEMHSMTALEALLSHLPIVCRRDDSFSDTVFHGKNGYFADSDEEMDGFILDLVDNEHKRKEFADASFEVSQNFSIRLHGLRTVAFYKEVLKHYPLPSPVFDRDLKKAIDSVKLT